MPAIYKNGKNYSGGTTVDSALSSTSTNPVQNKVVKQALDELILNFANYYNKTEVDSIVNAIKNSRFEAVATLPTIDIKTNVIYLVPKSPTQTNNAKDEYINLDGTSSGWEKIGDTEIDLSGYVTTTALNTALSDYTTTTDLATLLNKKVDKVQGKGLSTNDYTDAEKQKLANIESNAQANVQSDWNEDDTENDGYIKNKPNLSTSQTATGNPLTIESAESNLVECVAEVEAVQEGSGDPSPDNIRPIIGQTEVVIEDVGKNLFDEQTYPFTDGKYIYGATGGDDSSGVLKATLDYIPCDKYAGKTVTLNARPQGETPGIAFYDSNKTFVSGIKNNNNTSSSWTFAIPSDAKYMRFCVTSSATNVQIEQGNTATTYEPYKGKTYRVEIGQKNKLPMTVDGIKSANTRGTWNGNTYTINGVTFEIQTDESGNVSGIKINGTATNNSDFYFAKNISFTQDVIFSVSANKTVTNADIYYASAVVRNWVNGEATVNANTEGDCSIFMNNSFVADNVLLKPMLRTTIDDSEFVPYNPNLPDAIYGGELDVLTGKLRVDRGYITLSSPNSKSGVKYLFNYDSHTLIENSDIQQPSPKFKCDSFAFYNIHQVVGNNYVGISISKTSEAYYLYDLNTIDMTLSDAQTYYENNPLHVVYPLVTPYTIQLTPEQIRLLKGTNNISCNTGDLSIKYYPDNVLGQLKGDIESEIKTVNDKIKNIKTMKFTDKQTTDTGQLLFPELENTVIISADVYEGTYGKMAIPYIVGNVPRLKVVEVNDLSTLSYKNISGTVYYYEM